VANIPKNDKKPQTLTGRNQPSDIKKLNRLKNRSVVPFSFWLKLGEEREKKTRKVSNNNNTLLVICHNNKVCQCMSFQANQNAAFVDEHGKFKLQ